jgi:hypothetical protein
VASIWSRVAWDATVAMAETGGAPIVDMARRTLGRPQLTTGGSVTRSYTASDWDHAVRRRAAHRTDVIHALEEFVNRPTTNSRTSLRTFGRSRPSIATWAQSVSGQCLRSSGRPIQRRCQHS